MLLFALDVAIIVCNAIFGARVLAARPRLLTAQLIALIAFNSICHIVLTHYEYGLWVAPAYRLCQSADCEIVKWVPFLNFARNLTPGLFMVLCFRLFADKQRFPRWLLGLFALDVFLDGIARWLFRQDSESAVLALRTVPALLQSLFALFALYWAVANWGADLVEWRRRGRWLVVIVIGLNIISENLLTRVFIDQNTIANYYAHVAMLVTDLPIVLFLVIFLKDGDLIVPLEPPAAVRPRPLPVSMGETSVELERLVQLLEVQKVYRRPELSLGELANLVQLPEYRLRKLINEQLGYQNFNAFLHAYRIRDACQQLRDPEKRRVPVLTIALSTGYQSINTFNRGFRDVMGMTPSAYRALDDAAPPASRVQKVSPQSA